MKNSIKICLCLSLVLCIIGFSVVGVSIALGAPWKTVDTVRRNWTDHFYWNNYEKTEDTAMELVESEIYGTTYYSYAASMEDEGSIIDPAVSKIDIEIGYGNVTIYGGDRYEIFVYNESKYYEFKYEDNSAIKIEDKNDKMNWFTEDSAEEIQIEITVPKEIALSELNIDVGAGMITIADIKTDSMDINSGAGDVIIENSVVRDVDIESGAGEIVLCLAGKSGEYNCELSTGVGEVYVDGSTGLGFVGGHYEQKNNNRQQTIKAVSGVGNIYVEFMASE